MKECELEIGGQRIDKHYGHWHSVYSQLTEFNPSGSKDTLFNKMSGNGIGVSTDGTESHSGFTLASTNAHKGDTASCKLFIPLYFWFCRNPGLALPLIALQYHEVKVKITFEDIGNLVVNDTDDSFGGSGHESVATVGNNKTSSDFKLWCDYIYLDTDERRRFAQVSHEYLIEQVQFASEGTGGTMDLNFNHPVKELIWAGMRGTVISGGTASILYDRNVIGSTYQLKLNGHDRFKERDTKYFTRTQIWQHHTGYGSTEEEKDTIAVYSFALKPEEHQPSGTCNFSRIDNAQLVETGGKTSVNVYAVNYNVLRIMSGMGGLAYSN